MGGFENLWAPVRGPISALLLLCASVAQAACARTSYAGISFAPGAADPQLQALARRAQAGEKQAQLELGVRYEEGRGLPIDVARALRLYRLAASPSVGTIYVHAPGTGSREGGLISVRRGIPQAGLREAADRLRALSRAKPAGEP